MSTAKLSTPKKVRFSLPPQVLGNRLRWMTPRDARTQANYDSINHPLATHYFQAWCANVIRQNGAFVDLPELSNTFAKFDESYFNMLEPVVCTAMESTCSARVRKAICVWYTRF